MATVLITGANRGIGLEFVRQYAADGWKVHACCRKPKKAEALAALEGDIQIHKLNAIDYEALGDLAKKIKAPLDIVIANAGIGGGDVGEFGKLNFEAYLDLLNVNTVAPIAALEAFAPHLKEAKGKFAAISSILSSFTVGMTYAPAYCTSKAALNRALTGVAPSFADTGVAIGPFHPGWVRTDMGGPNADVAVEDSVAGLRKQIAAMKAGAPLRLVDYQGNEIGW